MIKAVLKANRGPTQYKVYLYKAPGECERETPVTFLKQKKFKLLCVHPLINTFCENL